MKIEMAHVIKFLQSKMMEEQDNLYQAIVSDGPVRSLMKERHMIEGKIEVLEDVIDTLKRAGKMKLESS